MRECAEPAGARVAGGHARWAHRLLERRRQLARRRLRARREERARGLGGRELGVPHHGVECALDCLQAVRVRVAAAPSGRAAIRASAAAARALRAAGGAVLGTAAAVWLLAEQLVDDRRGIQVNQLGALLHAQDLTQLCGELRAHRVRAVPR